MKLNIFTLALNAMPWITFHLPIFRQLECDWQWVVVEGLAKPVADTSWVADLPPQISVDGTSQYLEIIQKIDKRVTILRKPEWPGKTAMCNAAIEVMTPGEVLWQVDADEVWNPDVMYVASLRLLKSKKDRSDFFCHYFVGPDIEIWGDGFGNHKAYEWRRLWRWKPGIQFKTHEPPEINDERGGVLSQYDNSELKFDHYAFATEAQMAFKSRYYAGQNNPMAQAWRDSMAGWRRLQNNQKWPVKVREFLPFIADDSLAVRV